MSAMSLLSDSTVGPLPQSNLFPLHSKSLHDRQNDHANVVCLRVKNRISPAARRNTEFKAKHGVLDNSGTSRGEGDNDAHQNLRGNHGGHTEIRK